jgi:hypothetical protein
VTASRFVIEGLWRGYRSGQDRVVHRTVHTASEKRLRAWAEKTHAIYYTDGTSLELTVRDAKPRERVSVVNGYSKLIRDCMTHDVNSVAALLVEQEAMRKTRAVLVRNEQAPGSAS